VPNDGGREVPDSIEFPDGVNGREQYATNWGSGGANVDVRAAGWPLQRLSLFIGETSFAPRSAGKVAFAMDMHAEATYGVRSDGAHVPGR